MNAGGLPQKQQCPSQIPDDKRRPESPVPEAPLMPRERLTLVSAFYFIWLSLRSCWDSYSPVTGGYFKDIEMLCSDLFLFYI